MPEHGPRLRGAVAGVLTFGLVLGAAALGVRAFLDGLTGAPTQPEQCAATLDDTEWYLAPDQAETAALLASATVRRGMPARAATIAIATGLQESRLRNIDYGDRDSVGIFQQRPSQGWGTVEQIMDPAYSTAAFLDALAEVEGYESLPVTVAAQTVQRSAFPDAYAQHEVRSRAWASGLTGHSPAVITCALHPVEGEGDPDGLRARAERDLGIDLGSAATATEEADDGSLVRLVLDSAPLTATTGDPTRAGWVAAQWAVAVADGHGVLRVEHAGLAWQRESGRWEPVQAPAGSSPQAGGLVTIEVAAPPAG